MTIRYGIVSAKGNRLANDFIINGINLKSLKPQVKWSDDGVIVPEVGDATISFDAICLNQVILRIIKIYDSNIMSFLQEDGLKTHTEGHAASGVS